MSTPQSSLRIVRMILAFNEGAVRSERVPSGDPKTQNSVNVVVTARVVGGGTVCLGRVTTGRGAVAGGDVSGGTYGAAVGAGTYGAAVGTAAGMPTPPDEDKCDTSPSAQKHQRAPKST